MKTLAFHLVLMILLLAGSCKSDRKEAGTAVQAEKPGVDLRIHPRFRPADRTKYENIRDSRDWENPFVVVYADGVQLRCKAASIERRKLRVEELSDFLIALPPLAWPYGGIVAVQEASISGLHDRPRIMKNRMEIERILQTLGIAANLWPA